MHRGLRSLDHDLGQPLANIRGEGFQPCWCRAKTLDHAFGETKWS
jgi:hypothetical protein